MKKIILTILLLLCLSSITYSQGLAADNLQLPVLFLPNSEILSLSQMAYSPDYSATFSGKLGYGFLNAFFGLGSYLAGDWGWGIGLTLWQGLGFAGIIGFGWNDIITGRFFDGFTSKSWEHIGIFTLSGLGLGPLLFFFGLLGGGFLPFEAYLFASLGGAVFGGILGLCSPRGYQSDGKDHQSTGVLSFEWDLFSFGFWSAGVIFGIILPYLHRPKNVPVDEPPTARPDDLRNWDIGIIPAPDGRFAGRIAFTAHF